MTDHTRSDIDGTGTKRTCLPTQLPTELPEVMLDGIEQRRTEPAHEDDPAELQARLADLRERVAAAAGTPAGGWQTVGQERAARDLTARGVDLAAARAKVADYLRETSERVGEPAYGWGLDQGDLDAIAAEPGLPATRPPVGACAPVAAAPVGEDDDAEQARAVQLRCWHTDDTTTNRAASDADEGPADDGLADDGVGRWR